MGVGRGEETALLERKGAGTEAVNKSPPNLAAMNLEQGTCIMSRGFRRLGLGSA